MGVTQQISKQSKTQSPPDKKDTPLDYSTKTGSTPPVRCNAKNKIKSDGASENGSVLQSAQARVNGHLFCPITTACRTGTHSKPPCLARHLRLQNPFPSRGPEAH